MASLPEVVGLDGGLSVRPLSGHQELVDLCRLYREVFGYAGLDDGLNPRLLRNLLEHGGSVVGAVEPDGTLQAFAFGWTALDPGPADPHVYHFSQVAGIAPGMQGRGVGRVLKQVQAAVAERRGASRMRWTYNPLISRNAHFNYDVLGARGRWFTRDALGPAQDRVTVEWDLAASARAGQVRPGPGPGGLPRLRVGELRDEPGGAVLLGVPSHAPAATEPLGVELRGRVAELFDRGLEAVSCRRADEGVAVYRFEPGAQP